MENQYFNGLRIIKMNPFSISANLLDSSSNYSAYFIYLENGTKELVDLNMNKTTLEKLREIELNFQSKY
jgi:hypothetical protein